MTISNMHYCESNENQVRSGSYLHEMLKTLFLVFMFDG